MNQKDLIYKNDRAVSSVVGVILAVVILVSIATLVCFITYQQTSAATSRGQNAYNVFEELLQSGTLAVEVVNKGGYPIKDATVTIQGEQKVKAEKTDGKGVAEFTLPAGDYTIKINANGYAPHQKTVTIFARMTSKSESNLGLQRVQIEHPNK